MTDSKPPTVVHLKREKGKIVVDCDVYIGRRIKRGGWDLPQSKWANPFTIKKSGGLAAAINKYKEHIYSKGDLINSLHVQY